ncbi:MAG: His/Gly/Thr/Pro-type tRNA ligase C-terminal domain-containing protein, partial [Anaerolineaceae bacterium]
AALIPIADRHIDYAKQVAAKLRQSKLRVMVDDRSERMNAKIRDAQNQKIPYMLVIGDKEVENDQVALRLRNGENIGPIPLSAFIERANEDIQQKI